jgi:hypothetical protein
VLLSELVAGASNEAVNYFAQRRPRELAQFEWTIDAKDPKRITVQENGGATRLGRFWRAKAAARHFLT